MAAGFGTEIVIPTLDPDLKYHYGTALDGVEPGDRLTITPETPPQVARHEGYETAFLAMDPVEETVESAELRPMVSTNRTSVWHAE